MEYKEFAKYYDKFYQNKNYKKETEFLKNFINANDKILDIGCGTGIHAALLTDNGFEVDGLDLNKEMLEIAKTRLKTNLYWQNILEIDISKKYNMIISMFAVFNHLKDTDELMRGLMNLKQLLHDGGKIIIDLHNPQSSGSKIDTYDNMTRVMKWNYDRSLKIEKSDIIFEIDGIKYTDTHTFRIFTIDEMKECCERVGLKVVNVYENYDINKEGTSTSKNLQFLITIAS